MDGDEVKQRRIVYLTVAGIVLAVLGVVGTVFMVIAGVGALAASRDPRVGMMSFAPLGISVIGIGLVAFGLFSGVREVFGDDRKKPIETAGPVYVVSCLAYHRQADSEQIFDVDMYDPEDIKWVLKLRFANGISKEFTTAPEVVATLGEGLWGNITYQGRWILRFERVLVDVQR